MKQSLNLFLLTVVFLLTQNLQAKTVSYQLEISQKPMNISGKKEVDFSLLVNGGIPGPTLEFTEGDDAEITVINKLANEETMIHWHGILLPPLEDGVPYMNTPPILAGQSRTFKFKIRQHGTYWYHSHTMLQEQQGVYGAIVIHPKKELIKYDQEAVVVISDWTDVNPEDVLKNLKKDGDYYLFKKDSMRSYWGALKAGKLGVHLKNEWDGMPGMDLSDVGYDAFLINGKNNFQLKELKPGQKIRLRIINASASSYFKVTLGEQKFQVVSADGINVQPFMATALQMGMAETMDVIFTVLPASKNYELRATNIDGTGYASVWLGTAAAEKEASPNMPEPDLYEAMTMDHGSHASHNEHATHDAHANHNAKNEHDGHHGHQTPALPDVDTVTVDHLKALESSELKSEGKTLELKLVLGGNMARYVWYINDQPIFKEKFIDVKEGDVIRITYENSTMMHHPMHLHGHFFRVLNANGSYSPWKHTVDVPPHGSRTIEFKADEPGRWMLHCHNLYHMMTGMARFIRYEGYTPSAEIQHFEKHDHHDHDPWYFKGKALLATNTAELNLNLSQTYNEFSVKAEASHHENPAFTVGKDWEKDIQALYGRWVLDQTKLVAGYYLHQEESFGVLGVYHQLPFIIEGHALVSHKGGVRLGIEKHLQWTKTIFSELESKWFINWNDESFVENKITLMYGSSWHWNAGLVVTDHNLGAGFQLKF